MDEDNYKERTDAVLAELQAALLASGNAALASDRDAAALRVEEAMAAVRRLADYLNGNPPIIGS